ncbi:MAG: hypothetical protein ACRD0F_03500 [Acidimicrobiales bacterium]
MLIALSVPAFVVGAGVALARPGLVAVGVGLAGALALSGSV